MKKENSKVETDERKNYFEEIAKYREIKENPIKYNMTRRLMATSAINALQFSHKPKFSVDQIKENQKKIFEKTHKYKWIDDKDEKKKLRKDQKEFAEEVLKKEELEKNILARNKFLEEIMYKNLKLKRQEEEKELEAKNQELKMYQRQFSEEVQRRHAKEELEDKRKQSLNSFRNRHSMILQKEKNEKKEKIREQKEQKENKNNDIEKRMREIEKEIQEKNKTLDRIYRKKFSYTYYFPNTQQKKAIQECFDYIDTAEDFKERNLPHTNLQIFKMGIIEPSYHYKLTPEEKREILEKEREQKRRAQRQRIRSKYYYWSTIGNRRQIKVAEKCIELIDKGVKENQLAYTPLKIFKMGLEPRLDRMYPDLPLYNPRVEMPEEEKNIDKECII